MPRPQRVSRPRRTAARVARSENPHVRSVEVVTTPPVRAASAIRARSRVSVQYAPPPDRLDGKRRSPTLSVQSISEGSELDGNRMVQGNHGLVGASRVVTPF